MTEKLTKEECVKALNALYFSDGTDGRDDECYNVLMELINEHFDNPPLKPEELRDNMWVWDNKSKTYHFVRGIHKTVDKVLFIRASRRSSKIDPYYVDVEENRFYRKQVKE